MALDLPFQISKTSAPSTIFGTDSMPNLSHLRLTRKNRALLRGPGSRGSVVTCASGRRRWLDGDRFQGYGQGNPCSEFGPYPWQRREDGPWSEAEDESQPKLISFVTSEGMLTLSSDPESASRGGSRRRQRRVEGEYMDPMQQLCLGALFDIKAINGVSQGRLFCMDGFCRSVQMLSDVISDAVAEEGGEILAVDVISSSGLNERLQMTLVLPFLWGVPPKRDTLRKAVHEGGGIVHRCFQEWQFY